MPYKELEQELEEVYRKWQDGLENVAGLNEARRFFIAFKVKFGHYRSVFMNKNNLLQHTIDVCEKNLKRLRNVPQKIDESDPRKGKLKRKIEEFEKLEAKVHKDKEALDRLKNELYRKSRNIKGQALRVFVNFYQLQRTIGRKSGLTTAKIQRFRLFTADETHVGDQCSICMGDIDVGRRMRRLTCDGQHSFCQECIEGWFAEHNTCPICRHKFD